MREILIAMRERFDWILGPGPARLTAKQDVEKGEMLLAIDAVRGEGGKEPKAVEGEVPVDEPGFALLDPLGLDLRQRTLVEGGAMRAGQG